MKAAMSQNPTIEENASDQRADEGARSFARMFDQLNEGEAELEMSLKLYRLMRKLKADAASRGSAGESKGGMKLSLTFRVTSGGKEVDIGYDVAVKEPARVRRKASCWLTPSGNVSFEQPKQLGLPGMTLVGDSKRTNTLDDDEDPAVTRALKGDIG